MHLGKLDIKQCKNGDGERMTSKGLRFIFKAEFKSIHNPEFTTHFG